jgi:starvation-inducible outer membrane lipoprotein
MEEQDGLITGEKTGFFEPFRYKSHLFTKTGSGQTWENSKSARFLAAEVRKTPFNFVDRTSLY